MAGALVAIGAAAPVMSSTGSGASYPVIAAAGGIARDSGSSAYERRRGTASECQELATSRLLVAGRYAAVLVLGDEQY